MLSPHNTLLPPQFRLVSNQDGPLCFNAVALFCFKPLLVSHRIQNTIQRLLPHPQHSIHKSSSRRPCQALRSAYAGASVGTHPSCDLFCPFPLSLDLASFLTLWPQPGPCQHLVLQLSVILSASNHTLMCVLKAPKQTARNYFSVPIFLWLLDHNGLIPLNGC